MKERSNHCFFFVLIFHAILLLHQAVVDSPTLNEPAHAVAGISYWEHGQFGLYSVNPPLVKLVAALPILAVGYDMVWTRSFEIPGSRPEFALGVTGRFKTVLPHSR